MQELSQKTLLTENVFFPCSCYSLFHHQTCIANTSMMLEGAVLHFQDSHEVCSGAQATDDHVQAQSEGRSSLPFCLVKLAACKHRVEV